MKVPCARHKTSFDYAAGPPQEVTLFFFPGQSILSLYRCPNSPSKTIVCSRPFGEFQPIPPGLRWPDCGPPQKLHPPCIRTDKLLRLASGTYIGGLGASSASCHRKSRVCSSCPDSDRSRDESHAAPGDRSPVPDRAGGPRTCSCANSCRCAVTGR